ncbi:MAG: hypothetical protein EAZ51_10030, partial [Sphingobacteriales bacterium]
IKGKVTNWQFFDALFLKSTKNVKINNLLSEFYTIIKFVFEFYRTIMLKDINTNIVSVFFCVRD